MHIITDYFWRIGTYNPIIVAVELLLIGLVVYWAVNFLEGTRGERLFRGVIFVLVFGSLILKLVAEKFQFERLEYLYPGFLIAILIIAVAAFQPEIRRALIKIGQPKFLAASPGRLSKTVEDIITAVTQLSELKTGAIIAVEQQVALGEFIETGVRINANVSSALLKTIFYQGTALHDMAVVIRADRIVAARVQLPLAEGGSVEGVELGSRHRAAIGLTRGSDASVIVVSEETGVISLALGGKLTRNIDESELRKHLTATMVDAVPLVGRFWKMQKKSSQAK